MGALGKLSTAMALAVSVACGSAAQAAVSYEFDFNHVVLANGGFDVSLPAHATGTTLFNSSQLTNAYYNPYRFGPATLQTAGFFNDYLYFGPGLHDVVSFSWLTEDGGMTGWAVSFDRAAFQRNGTHYALGLPDGYFATLKVTGVSGFAPIPEPSTWAILLIGFAILGGTMRSARQNRALAAHVT